MRAPDGLWNGRSLLARFWSGVPRDFVPNVGWQWSGTAAASVLSFLYTLVMARALGAGEFGLMTLALAFAALVSQFATLRLPEMVIRYAARFQEENDPRRLLATVKLSLLLDAAAGAFALALILALSPLAKAWLLRDERALLFIALAGAGYVIQNVADDTALGLLRVFSRFKTIAIIEAGANAMKLVLAAGAVWLLGWGVVGVLALLIGVGAATNLTFLLVALATLRRRTPLGACAPLSLLRPYAGEIRRFLLHNYAISLTGSWTRELDVNILGFFSAKETVAVYKVARSFTVALYQPLNAAFLVVYPELARLWARADFSAVRMFVRRVAILAGAGTAAAYALGFLMVPWFLVRVMPESFAGAGALFRWMGWGVIPIGAMIWVGPLLTASGRTDLFVRCTLIAGLLAPGLYALAVWRWDAVGAAVAAAVVPPLSAVIGLWYVKTSKLLYCDEAPTGV